jgi:hypothetical protein
VRDREKKREGKKGKQEMHELRLGFSRFRKYDFVLHLVFFFSFSFLTSLKLSFDCLCLFKLLIRLMFFINY